MKVLSINVNGIRSAIKKGLIDWLLAIDADVICLQETKMRTEDDPGMSDILPGYRAYYADAEKKGYSGVAILTRLKPDKVHSGLGFPLADMEGRYIQADFGQLSIASLYMPSGSSSPERQVVKFEFLDRYLPILQQQLESERHYIICGDWNIAHKAIDLKNWRANQKNSGFLPEERAWMDTVLEKMGWVDAFRVLNQSADEYTWWSNRGQAWAKNVGWRIDYQIISPQLRDKVNQVSIYREQRFSDHAPLIVGYIPIAI
ncbi:MAG: exodeoxyribonuclease III [Legionellales bacterium]|nr:exodeoxyribonuclease III [Legionellales bacterium]